MADMTPYAIPDASRLSPEQRDWLLSLIDSLPTEGYAGNSEYVMYPCEIVDYLRTSIQGATREPTT